MLTICALFYGDYPDLAARLLASLDQADMTICDFRFATNAASPDTVDMVKNFLRRHANRTSAHRPNVLQVNLENRYKYPVMRDLLHGSGSIPPVHSPYVMWFDDDSYVKEPDAIVKALKHIQDRDAYLIGEIWKWSFDAKQLAWIRDQPWCPPDASIATSVSFVTGGWWLARTPCLRYLDYPWPSLTHNGGDVMLSTALRLHRYEIANYNHGFAINADAEGRNAKAKRRGASHPPVGK